MVKLDDLLHDPALRESLEALGRVTSAALDDGTRTPGDIPSAEETRELLGLYAKLPSEDVRRAVLGLLRAIVGLAA